MSDTGDRFARLMTAMLPVSLVGVLCAHFLSLETLVSIVTVLTAWTCTAVPVGVLVGHCTLSER